MEPNNNTLLFHDTLYGRVAYYRRWEGGKSGHLVSYHGTIQVLIDYMNSPRQGFSTPFRPEGGIPDIDFGVGRNRSDFRPFTDAQVREVIQALNG